MRQIRTDMAREALLRQTGLEGVQEQREAGNGVAVSRIQIETREAAQALHKPIGRYVTIEAEKELALVSDEMAACIGRELASLLAGVRGHVLVVGLGNRDVTPDSLGPRTVEKLFVTRHIGAFTPELAPEGMRDVSAMVPGVLGVTGLETLEVVRGVVKSVRPEAVLCVDALCAQRVERITAAVQLNDKGLLPGAGVGNRQQGLNEDTLGVPVFAIGVPTVVFASTIAEETIRLIEAETGVGDAENTLSAFAGALIEKSMGELVVTPKDVDKLVEDASRRIAKGVNLALHGAHCDALSQLLMH